MGQDIAGELLVNLGRVGLHGLLHIQHKGKLLILHLQRPDALHGGHLILRHHHGHIVAVIADMAVQQQPVGHILMAGVRGPGVSRRGEWAGRARQSRSAPAPRRESPPPRRCPRTSHSRGRWWRARPWQSAHFCRTGHRCTWPGRLPCRRRPRGYFFSTLRSSGSWPPLSSPLSAERSPILGAMFTSAYTYLFLYIPYRLGLERESVVL